MLSFCARVMFCSSCLCYVYFFVRVTCRLQSALCEGFRLCYVKFAVTKLVASLRASLASLAWLASLAAGPSPSDGGAGMLMPNR